MKKVKRLMLFACIFACMAFAACSTEEAASNGLSVKEGEQSQTQVSQPSESQTPATPAPSEEASPEPIGSDPMSLPPYSYDIESSDWNVEGIDVKYPAIVNSNMREETDKANELIKNDMSKVIGTIKSDVGDKTLTIDGTFEYARISPTILSIKYDMEYGASSLAYPVSLCHTITISLDKAAAVPLSDLFTIDESFVGGFKSWTYAPCRDDLNLESSGVDLKGEIERQYTDGELIKLFSQTDATYFLSDRGLVLSIGVPHALGDHLEMTMGYESLEAYMKKDEPVWKDYTSSGEDNSNETSDSIDAHIKVGGIFTATLDENPSTGYGWQYKIGEGTVVSYDSDSVLEDGSNSDNQPAIVGAGNRHEWNFKGLKKGSTTITFEYLRSWESADKAAKTITYNITVE